MASSSGDAKAPGLSAIEEIAEGYLATAKKGDLLPLFGVKWTCETAMKLLREEPNILNVSCPVTVVGDIHGQFYDLLKIFEQNGYPPATNYVFLGDYVDRGANSVQVMTLLLCLKIRYPKCMTLLRGNHECRQISSLYGFFAECSSKFKDDQGADVWKLFTDMFDYLPLGALIDNRILCIHAGMSPGIISLDQIRVMERFTELEQSYPLQDLMWSDPSQKINGFYKSDRGNGYLFGRDIVDRFLEENKLELIVRSHQLCKEGHQVLFDKKLITVWSAPNYCYRMGNKASVLVVDQPGRYRFNTFEASTQNRKIAEEQES